MSQAPNSTAEYVVLHDYSWPIIHTVLRFKFNVVIIVILGHLLLLVITAIVTWVCVRLKLRGSARHALYGTLGVFLVVGESLLMMCHNCYMSGWWFRRYLHACLGAFALLTGLLGILSKCLAKERRNKRQKPWNQERHLASKHSRFGLLAYLLLWVCASTGIALAFVSTVGVHLTHRLAGLGGFLGLTCSQWFAYNSAFARQRWRWQWIRALKVLTMFAAVCVTADEMWMLSVDIVHLVTTNLKLRG